MKYTFLTTFPDFFTSALNCSIVGRAISRGIIAVELLNLRDYSSDSHRSTDDSPYGGGPGMVMMVEPIYKAVASIKKKSDVVPRVVALTARGKRFTQTDARRLAQEQHLVLICGHYGDIDQRVVDYVADEELSIGDFVVTGGEVAALVILDATARLIPEVLGNADSLITESHEEPGLSSPPQYTRPASYKGWTVPNELLSGDPQQIAEWKRQQHV